MVSSVLYMKCGVICACSCLLYTSRRIAADDAVVALAGLILYDRGALNGAEHGNGLLCRVADLDGIDVYKRQL